MKNISDCFWNPMLHDWLIYNCWWAPKKINDKQEILKKIPPKNLVSDGNITYYLNTYLFWNLSLEKRHIHFNQIWWLKDAKSKEIQSCKGNGRDLETDERNENAYQCKLFLKASCRGWPWITIITERRFLNTQWKNGNLRVATTGSISHTRKGRF